MSIGKKLINSSIFRNLEFFIALGVTFTMAPVIVHSLGDRMYGFWTLVGTFLGYYGLLDFGLSSAAARYISKSLGKGDTEDMNSVASTAFFLFSAVGAAAFALTLAIAASCPVFIKDQGELQFFRNIILIMGITTAIGFPMRVFGGILTSYLRYDYIAYISIARTLIANAAIYYYLKDGYGVIAIAVINFAASILQHAATYIVCKVKFPQIRLSLSRFDRARVKTMFSYGGKTFIAQIADILRFKVDSFVIAGYLNLSLVTYYSIGAKFVEYFTQLMVSSVGTMAPVFSQYEGRGDYDSIRRTFLVVTKISTMLSVFIGFSLLFYARPFIIRWMGPGFEKSYYITLILCIPHLIAMTQVPGVSLLYGISKHKFFAVTNTFEGVFNLVLSLIFVRYYGMYGVALGTAVAMATTKLFLQPGYVCRSVQISLRLYLVDTILVTTLKAGVPLGLYFYIIKDVVRPDYSVILICCLVQALLFIPVAYFFVAGKTERQLIKGAVGYA